jgi:hypothetical protein
MSTGPGTSHKHTTAGRASTSEAAHTHANDPALATKADLDAAIAAHVAKYHATTPPDPVPPINGYPPDSTLKVIPLPTPPPVPARFGTVVTLPGTITTRVSDAGVRHAYSKLQPWSKSGKWLLMTYGSQLLDGQTYITVKTLGTLPGYANWSTVNDDWLLGTYDGDPNLYRLDVVTGAMTSVRNFGKPVSLGKGEGGISDNGRLALLDDTGNCIVVDEGGATIRDWFSLGGNPDNCTMSRDGAWVGVDFGSGADGTGAGKGCWSFGVIVAPGRQLATVSRHGDTAVTPGGTQVWVNVANGVEMYDLATGAKTALLPVPNAYSFGHVSGRGNPGWAYLSVYDTSAVAGLPGNDQLVAVKLDGSQTVRLYGLAMSRSSSYEHQPQAVPNRDGTKMLATSDFGTSSYYDFVWAAQ